MRSRDGDTGPRREGDIGFAALRGGDVVGEHRVIFAGPGERIELAHIATDRGIFARGAVKAALWARGREPGPLFDAGRARPMSDKAARRLTLLLLHLGKCCDLPKRQDPCAGNGPKTEAMGDTELNVFPLSFQARSRSGLGLSGATRHDPTP